MELLVKVASPLGRYAEELDLKTDRRPGEVLQAFSHLGAVEAAARIVVADRLVETTGLPTHATSPAAGRHQAAARGRLSAELVELVRGAPQIVAFGAEPERLADIQAAAHKLVSLSRRDARATGAASELIADVCMPTRGQRRLLVTHRTEVRELVDRAVSLAPAGTPNSISHWSPR